MLNEEKIKEVTSSLRSIIFTYLQVNGQKAVSLVDYIGFPVNRITICTLNPTNIDVLYNYCLNRSIVIEKLNEGLLTLKLDEAYKLLALLKLEGY